MWRDVYQALLGWCDRKNRMPLVLRGARQVGKTYLIEQLAAEKFSHFHNINFELAPEYKKCFTSLEPHRIIDNIAALSGHAIKAGQALLFLDEIQLCPQAIVSLRYFKEKMPELHVIAAGSLLEFALRDEDLHMPVGRIEYMYVKPISFIEYLKIKNHDLLIKKIKSATLESPLDKMIHEKLLQLILEYTVVGGMPAAVQDFLDTQLISEAKRQQNIILTTYRDDFGKYAKQTDHKYLQSVFDATPSLIGQQVSYTKIDREAKSRDLKRAITDLQAAGVLNAVVATKASGLPLSAQLNHAKFKLIYLDIGLITRLLGIHLLDLQNQDLILINKGALSEQFVGQELLAYGDYYEAQQLYYWQRDKVGAQAEIDYVMTSGTAIIPIEVKAGNSSKLKSLQIFMQEKNIPIGVRISQGELKLESNILSIPFYMLGEIRRLYNDSLPN